MEDRATKDLDTIPWADRERFPTAIYAGNSVGTKNRRKWVDGETVEEGRHDELLARDGEYARLYRRETQEKRSE